MHTSSPFLFPQNITDDTPIEDDFGKHLPLADVMTMSIKVMKDHVIKLLGDTGVPYPEAGTKWVITVPAIWSDPAKQVTRNAAEKVNPAHHIQNVCL